MNDYWNARLAPFEGVPVVDVYGVLEGHGWGAWSAIEGDYPYQPTTEGFTSLTFAVWRIGQGEINLARCIVFAFLSYGQWNSLTGFHTWSSFSPVVHIKARVTQNPQGFPDILLEEWIGAVKDDVQLNEIYQQLNEAVILDLPPLPPLELSAYDGSWMGTISLPLWSEFSIEPDEGDERQTQYQLQIRSVDIPPVRVGYKGVLPTPEQIAAYNYLTQNEKASVDAVLRYMLDNYPQWQEDYGGDPEYMPDVTDPEQFKSLIMVRDVAISLEAKDGFAYVYFSFDPEWDIEHGVGAILHKDRVVAMSDHDSLWRVMERDQEV